MSDGSMVAVGVDCGEPDPTAVFFQGNKIETLPPAETGGPLILFDAHGSVSTLGVGFPSVFQRLGVSVQFPKIMQRVGGSAAYEVSQSLGTPDSIATDVLRHILRDISALSGGKIGTAVLAVPASLRHNGRKALVECASAAGFEKAMLIDRGTAAAIGYHRYRDKTTAVVIDIGYGNCDVSLLRLTKERCRVVACETLPSISGELLDAAVMEAVVLALRKQQLFLGLRQFTFIHWLEFRRLAETVRNTLRDHAEMKVTLVPEMTGLDRTINLRLTAAALANKAASMLSKTIDAIHAMVEQNELSLNDIDLFLLTGRAANQSPVADVLGAALGPQLRRSEACLAAVGAALQAHQSTEQGRGALPDSIPGAVTPLETSKPWTSSGFNGDLAEVIDMFPVPREIAKSNASDSAREPEREKIVGTVASTQDLTVGLARKLLSEGRPEEALQIVRTIGRDLNQFLNELQAEAAGAKPRMLIGQAQAMLNTGRFSEAVALSHEAYEMGPGDPEVFSAMMKIHADAALALDTPEEYEAAIRFLMCAHQHDQTDRSIHKALAERYYMHAAALRNLNNTAQALRTANLALSFDPKHAAANRLAEELTPSAMKSGDGTP